MKKIFNLKEIINFLIQNNYFKIYLFHQKTNYNLDNQTLYLNYSDLYETTVILKNIKNPPFKIQMNLKMDKKYTFDLQKKILYLKEEPQVNKIVTLKKKLYQQIGVELSQENISRTVYVERAKKQLFGDNDFA